MVLSVIVPVVVVASTAVEPILIPFFKETISLSPDVDRIAVLVSGAPDAVVADDLGLELVAEHDRPAMPAGWMMLQRSEAAVGGGVARSLDQTLDRARRHRFVRFASPVLHGSGESAVDEWRVVTPDLIVQFEPTVSRQDAEALLAAIAGGRILARDAFGLPNAFRVRLDTTDGRAALALASTISAMDSVRFAEPDMLMSAWPSSDDPLIPSQWALENTAQAPTPCGSAPGTRDVDLDVDAAWASTTGDPALIVLVIDNGVQFDHPDLLADPALGFDATGDNGGGWPVHPCDDHGTPVAGIIAALAGNGIGTAGIAPSIRIASARISNVNSGCSLWTVQSSWVAAALEFGLGIGAKITNTSWSFPTTAVTEEAYANAQAQGVLHFASAGNGGSEQLKFPAKLPTVLAVSALRNTGVKATFSSYGEGLDFAAPGVDVLSADRTGSEGYSSDDATCFGGTSAAAPCVAGVAALALSANPTLTNAMVGTVLRRTAKDLGEPGYDLLYGWGLPRAGLVVSAAMHPSDLDLDGDVDAADLGALLAAWGSASPVGDIDGNGVVDAADLGMLLVEWE